MSLQSFGQVTRILALQSTLKRISCMCFYSSKSPQQGIVKEIDPDTGILKTKKTTLPPKVTLISGESVSVTTLQEAEKLSKRRDLKLVKITDFDTKTQRPVYKLMTGAEYHAEDLKQREKRKLDKQHMIKGEKVLLLNSRIARHDLDTQLRKAIKWIKKMYEVRVIISGNTGNGEASEKVYNNIQEFLKSEESAPRIHQKLSKGSDIKFQISPQSNKNGKKEL